MGCIAQSYREEENAMPVHDWLPVDANVYHHFHQMWTMHICDALNDGLLPAGYSALIDQRSPTVAPDVLALERRIELFKSVPKLIGH